MNAGQKTQVQMMTAFWDVPPDRRFPNLPPPPTDAEIHVALSPNNSNCPLNDIIVSPENEGNLRNLRRFAYTAFRRFNHSLRGCSFGIYSPPGQGKTFVVKKFAETIKIPFVFVQSSAIEDTWTLFEEIGAEFKKHGTPLVPFKNKQDPKSDFTLPPCIVFFDEAHMVPKKMMKGGLLNAMEADDGYMAVRQPGSKDSLLVNCQQVCWVAATTERGMLFDAFESRLPTPIEWASATRAELVTIVKQATDKRFHANELPFPLPLEACEVVAKYQRTPRLARDFGVKVVQQKAMMPSDTWEEACKTVADDCGIDDSGMSKKQVAILAALGQRPIAENRLDTVTRCRMDQVRRYELPGLMTYNGGGPFVVAVSGKGMCLTAAGMEELDRRGIAHNGEKVTAEYFESKR